MLYHKNWHRFSASYSIMSYHNRTTLKFENWSTNKTIHANTGNTLQPGTQIGSAKKQKMYAWTYIHVGKEVFVTEVHTFNKISSSGPVEIFPNCIKNPAADLFGLQHNKLKRKHASRRSLQAMCSSTLFVRHKFPKKNLWDRPCRYHKSGQRIRTTVSMLNYGIVDGIFYRHFKHIY